MPSVFPPVPVYPDEIDSDYTLYLVHNTTETILTADNQPWSSEILIKPKASDAEEVWADNGFANINGELLYYDAVDKNDYDKVVKLKKCARNLDGDATTYNSINSDIRSYVIAQHHNQLVQALINIQEFLGGICDDTNTLACCLEEIEIDECEDDGLCPNVLFDYSTVSESTCDGTDIEYEIEITGNFTRFQLDFGDGTFTNIPQSGTKHYPPGSIIDPVITVGSNFCETVITGVQRTADSQPETATPEQTLTFPIPDITIPEFSIPSITIPSVDITLPPLVQPCIDLEPIDISVGPISIGDINIPSVISIISPDFGPISLIHDLGPISLIHDLGPISLIAPDFGPISLIHDLGPISLIHDLGPISLIAPDLHPISLIHDLGPISLIHDLGPISLIGDIGPISLIHDLGPISLIVPSIDDIYLIVPSFDYIYVNWGSPPSLVCTVSIACPESCDPATSSTTPDPSMAMASFLDDDIDGLPLANLEVDYDFAGIPSKIIVEAPDIDPIQIEHSLPKSIELRSPNIPNEIYLRNADLIRDISVIMPEDFVREITINSSSMPKEVSINWGDIPSLKIDTLNFPTVIEVKSDIPSIIQVEGFPEYIPVKIENPYIEMIYRGDPLEVKIKLDVDQLITDGEDGNTCVAIVPCKK